MRTGRYFVQDARATTAIEFALVAPLLFTILFGIIVFGLQYATRIALTYAAAEGGRAAVAGLTDSERTSLAQTAIANTLAALSPLVVAANATVTVAITGAGSGGETIAITIAYADSRFATLPYVPNINGLNPVAVQYYVTDPSG